MNVDVCKPTIDLIKKIRTKHGDKGHEKAWEPLCETIDSLSVTLHDIKPAQHKALSTFLDRIEERLETLEKYLTKLSKKNTVAFVIFGPSIRHDIKEFNTSLHGASQNLNFAVLRSNRQGDNIEQDMRALQESIAGVKDETLDLKAVVMEAVDGKLVRQDSTSIEEVPYEELRDKKLIHPGSRGRNIFSATFFDEEVAVKMLGESQPPTDEDIIKFKREIRLTSSLNNKHIVQVYGACTEKNNLAIVMEKMTGDLGALLHQSKDMPWSKKLQIAKDVAAGLSFLHRKQIMHRDITSKNILYNASGQFKVSDFGIAKYHLDPKTQKPGERPRGTPAWLAPELFNLGLHYSLASDIYAYGVVLWELATHLEPRKGLDYDAIRKELKNETREAIPKTVPKDFAKLIKACWSQNATDRPDISKVKSLLEDMEFSDDD